MGPNNTAEGALPTPRPAAEIALHAEQCKYLYQLFDADEKEVRQLERYLLVAIAAIFSFLVNQITKADYTNLWYFPAFLTCIAGIRAGALGNRQRVWLRTLAEVEQRWATSVGSEYRNNGPGWASLYNRYGSYAVTGSAMLFYVALLALTIFTGFIGAEINHQVILTTPRVVH
jgi:hypothetical protein